MAESALALLPAAKRKMLLHLADKLAEDDEVQLDAVVCQLPSLETDNLDVLRQGLEILFERAGPAMVVDKETFLDAMAIGQLSGKSGKVSAPSVAAPSGRGDGRRSARPSRPEPEPPAHSERSDPSEEGESLAPEGSLAGSERLTITRGYPPAQGRRKSTETLEEEMRNKEMRECSFAPKTNKYPAYLKWNTARSAPRLVTRSAAATSGGLLPDKAQDRSSRRTQRVKEMVEERNVAEQKECTFAPKIHRAPRPATANATVRPDQSLRGGVRPRFKWQESLRGNGLASAQPAFREETGTQLARSFFSPSRCDGDSSRCSSEEREARGPRARSGLAHEVVLRDV